MKCNLSKTSKISQSKARFYAIASVTILIVAALIIFENDVGTTIAQIDTPTSNTTTTTTTANNNTNTTLAIDQQQQQSSFHPQVVLIIEEQGKITNQRVVEVHPLPIIESTFVANQTILGNIPARDLGTYLTTIYTDGSLLGEGHGISTTADGEIVTWTAEGVGTMNSEGDIRFEGSLFFHTSSTGELSYLNNKVGFFDYIVDSEGNTSANVWELK